jgi:anti-anti-sigma factor
MFEITLHTEQTILCIAPEGRLDTVNCTQFELAVKPHAEKENHLIFDLSKCNYLSSSGIRVLLSTTKKMKAKGGALSIAGIVPEVYQVLEMAGLHRIFLFSSDCKSAADEINRINQKKSNCSEWVDGEFRFQFIPVENKTEPALIWNSRDIAGYNELGFSVGTGVTAEEWEGVVSAEDLFVSTGNCAGFISGEGSSDFRIPYNPSQAGILVDQALSFGPNPDGFVRLVEPASIALHRLADSVYQLRSQIKNNQPEVLSMVCADFNTAAPSVTICILLNQSLVSKLNQRGISKLPGSYTTTNNGISLWGAKFELEEIKRTTENTTLTTFLKEALTLENILDVKHIELSATMVNPLTWLFVAERFENALTRRIMLDVPDEGFSEPYKAFLTRRLYADSVRVSIKPLHGGFSAQTFQVTSFDRDGRKLRPTVLKLANRAMITREAERCQKYSLPYILNNSAMVLGTEFFGDFGALCYNFVGIGGEQTQLKWLTNYYDEWPAEKLEPIFDKTFLQILNPWYGQPVREAIHPFLDHDPTLTFFSSLCDTAENTLSVSTDEPFFMVEEIGRKLVNPYWYLKHEYPKRRETAIDYLTAICHGDLNMQNILLDQTMNVYLIDFSETKPRSVVSDFARLEAIFMVERAPLGNEEETRAMIEFVTRFYGIDRLDQLPENSYRGSGAETVNKNVAITRKMREYAIKSTGGNTNLAPYYLAMLEWTLPIVCFYATPAHKRFSMIVAGLLCEKVMELMPG